VKTLVVEGVLALRRVHIDQLPSHVKGRAFSAIKKTESVAEQMRGQIDSILRQSARSELIGPNAEAEAEAQARAARLEGYRALFPGTWRAPRKKRG